MKTIVWFSRHDMTDAQADGLIRAVGEGIVEKVDFTAPSAGAVLEAARDAFHGHDPDILCVVLPVDLLADLMAQKKPWQRVFVAKSARQRDAATGEFKFIHKHWEEITRCEYEAHVYE